MKEFKTYSILGFIFLFFFSSVMSVDAQSDAETRALWTFNIAYGTTWQNQEKIDTFRIAVFSSENEFKAFTDLAVERTIHDKPVKVYRYEKYEAIKQAQIVYVTKSQNAFLGFVYEKFKGKNVLIICDRTVQPEYSVINYRLMSDSKKFDLNTLLGSKQKLNFTDQIIKLGGNREDLQSLFSKTNNKLKETQSELERTKTELRKKKQKIKELEEEIRKLKKQN